MLFISRGRRLVGAKSHRSLKLEIKQLVDQRKDFSPSCTLVARVVIDLLEMTCIIH